MIKLKGQSDIIVLWYISVVVVVVTKQEAVFTELKRENEEEKGMYSMCASVTPVTSWTFIGEEIIVNKL